MNRYAISPIKPLNAALAIVAFGVLIGLATVIVMTAFRPVLIAFGFAGLLLLIATLGMREQRAYWLFLLVLSIPLDISKQTTKGLVDPFQLVREFGPPLSGTVSFDVYLTDVILFMMCLPWLIRIFLGRDGVCFPKIGYIFVLYLAWSFFVSLIRVDYLYLSMFEWCRQLLYFVFFLYIVNNVQYRPHFRAVMAAVMVGLVLGAGTVITLSEIGVGLETNILSGIYQEMDASISKDAIVPGAGAYAEGGSLTKATKRSAGLFEAPALAAYHLEFCLPLALALSIASTGAARILFGILFSVGTIALYLTYARAGLIGFIAGLPTILVATWLSGLTDRRTLRKVILVGVALSALCAPLVVWSVTARLETFSYRIDLLGESWEIYTRHPIFGAGFGARMEGARESVPGDTRILIRSIHNQYLTVLTTVGIVGFILYFGFFWRIITTAFRCVRVAQKEDKALLVAIIGSLASIAMHSMADGFGRHVTPAMLWLFAGLVVAIARRVQADKQIPVEFR